MSSGDTRYYTRLFIAFVLFMCVIGIYKEPRSDGLCAGLGIIGFILAVDWRFLQ